MRHHKEGTHTVETVKEPLVAKAKASEISPEVVVGFVAIGIILAATVRRIIKIVRS